MKRTFLYVGSVVILILAAVTFIFIPSASPFARQQNPVFGTYDGKPIELAPGSELARSVNYYTQLAQRQGELSDSTYFSIYNDAFREAVVATAAKTEVAKSGYEPSKKAVSRILLTQFTDEDGNYDPQAYNRTPQADIESTRAEIRRSLILTRFIEDQFGSSDTMGDKPFFGLKSTDAELSFLAEMGAEKRAFDMVAFSKDDYPESEVRAFAAENTALFEEFDISVITVADEAEAKKVLAQLKAGDITFEDAVAEFSDKYYSDPDGKGKVTASHRYQVAGILADSADIDKIAALTVDALGDPIKTSNGWSVFRKDGAQKPADLDDAATLAAVRTYIRENESGRIEDYFINRAESFTSSAQKYGFEEAAELFGTQKIDVPAFALNYGNSTIASQVPATSVPQLARAATNENFLLKAFSLAEGDYSEPLVLDSNVIVLRLSAVTTDDVTATQKDAIKTDISSFDNADAGMALHNGPKVVNNVFMTYYNNFMQNR